MTRMIIEIDERLVDLAVRLHRLPGRRAAVDLALRRLVGEPIGREEALAMEGSGWAGDLEKIRAPDEIPGGDPARQFRPVDSRATGSTCPTVGAPP